MGRRKKVRVRKAAGHLENFKAVKLRGSLIRSGADPSTAEDIVDDVLERVGLETTTREIYRIAHTQLRKMDRACGVRYTLKSALFRLGPTGYPFEHFIADIFKDYGYRTRTGKTLEGKCTTHEVDVLAVNDREVSVMECKFHKAKGTTTDVKVALYVHSRIRDLEPTIADAYPGREYSGRIVTNTRFTADALRYARCSGFSLLSWKYPDGGGLEQMIESRKLYPVTIVTGIQAGLVDKLIAERILLLRDLLTLDETVLRSRLGLSRGKARLLRKKAEALCG